MCITAPLTYNRGNNIRNNATFRYRFDSPQVKENLISTTKNIEYELPHELPINLRLRSQETVKFQENLEVIEIKKIRRKSWKESVASSLQFRKKDFSHSSYKLKQKSKFLVSFRFCLIS